MVSSHLVRNLKNAIDAILDDAEAHAEFSEVVFAVQTLLAQQFVLEADHRSRGYKSVAANWDLVSAILELCGFKAEARPQAGIYGIQVRTIVDAEGAVSRPPLGRPVGVSETCLLLTLRDLYDIGMREGRSEIDAPSTVLTTTDAINTAMADLGERRRYTNVTALLGDLKKLQAHHLIAIGQKGADGLQIVRLLPTLPIVTGEAYFNLLIEFVEAAKSENPERLGKGADAGVSV